MSELTLIAIVPWATRAVLPWTIFSLRSRFCTLPRIAIAQVPRLTAIARFLGLRTIPQAKRALSKREFDTPLPPNGPLLQGEGGAT